MRNLFIGLLVLVLALPLVALGLVYLALEDAPSIDRPVAFTPAQIARAKRIVEGQRPARRQSGTLGSVAVTPEDADLAANYLAYRIARGSAHVTLHEGSAHVTLSLPLPANPLGRYANIGAILMETAGVPDIRSVRVGPVPVPDVVADALVARGLAWMRQRADIQAGYDAIQSVRLSGRGVGVVYVWHDDLPDRLRSAALTPADRERLRFYQERLAAIPGSGTTSLTTLLTPLMAAAAQRAQGGDAVAENRAALLVLTVHVLGHRLEMIDPEAAAWPHPPRRTVTLASRDDFPKHFLVSAALAAHAGSALSDAIGLWKEVDDSRGGSGFSFNDIAADRAGTRFGEHAVDAAMAASLQTRVAAGVRESDILPPTADLPEFMPEAEFKARFGGIGAPAYQRMMEEIERRVDALPL